MTLPDKLLKKLACPKCLGSLKINQTEERLECDACRVTYRITDDIPVLQIDEAQEMK